MNDDTQATHHQQDKRGMHLSRAQPKDLADLIGKFMVGDKKNALKQVLYSLMNICQVPELLGGVPMMEYIQRKLVSRDVFAKVMSYADMGYATFAEILDFFLPHAREAAATILKEACLPLMGSRNAFSKLVRDNGLDLNELNKIPKHPLFVNYRQVMDQMVGAGYHGTTIPFEEFAIAIGQRFLGFSVLAHVRGSMRILPSACAMSSNDLRNMPQVNLAAILVLWSLGMNMPVILFTLNGATEIIRLCSSQFRDGRPVTKEDYDTLVYYPNVSRVVNSTTTSLGSSDMKMDTANNTAAHTTKEVVERLNAILKMDLTVPLGVPVEQEKQEVFVFTGHNGSTWLDDIFLQGEGQDQHRIIDYQHTLDRKKQERHTGDMQSYPGFRIGAHIAMYEFGEFPAHGYAGNFKNCITDKTTVYKSYIVDKTTAEYKGCLTAIQTKTGLVEARRAIEALPSTTPVLQTTTEAFAQPGANIHTLLAFSYFPVGDKRGVLMNWATPTVENFNVHNTQQFHKWSQTNLAAAATKGFPSYMENLVDAGVVTCPLSGSEIERAMTEYRANMSGALTGDKAQLEKVYVAKAKLSNVMPLPDKLLTSMNDLLHRHCISDTEATMFLAAEAGVQAMARIAESAATLKAVVMAASNQVLTADEMGVNAASISLSSRSRYTSRKKAKTTA